MSQSPASEAIAKAVTYSSRGGYEVIGVGQRLARAPKAGEVRIKVRAAAINPTDILLRDPGQGDVALPMTPGMDAAGVVEAVGAGVSRLTIGEEVMAAVLPARPEGGAQASFIVIPAGSAVRKPEGVTLVEAATLPMNGLTALSALDQAALSPGQTFAVSGGAGWLAYLTIVLAKRRGLRVIADAKAEEADVVHGYGADIVVKRGPDFAGAVLREVSEGVDALFDTAVLGEAVFSAIKDGGTYIPVRGWLDKLDEPRIRIRPVMVPKVIERTEWLDTLRREVEAGHIKPHVAAEFVPEEAAGAQRMMMAGGVRGRIVLVF